ncbi:cellulose biosynthesis protein BcsP [Paraburkholderia sp. BCC1885]|uniref:cellulose biosynthesis protein BcsP n=1 Tax=Paraburkholderia sp. BCC1885 TaxID=2562669 RepID=UPI001183B784|nr:cellulose biosynthesis protein BcsP [Paraburkholderia sp. BCC1885]
MSPSSDIETLFGHFGGNAGDYQEIGRENEASSARTRWPLLVTLDLTQPSIPAVPQRRDAGSGPAADATQAPTQTPDAGPQAVNGLANAERIATPQVRSKTPLFTRPHRRSIPPVDKAVKVEAPRGAERFSAVPMPAAQSELVASDVQTAAPAPASGIPAAPAPQVPVAASAATPVAPVSHMPPAFAPAPAMVPVAVPPVVAHATIPAPAFRPSTPPAVQSPAESPAAPPTFFNTRGAAPAPAAFMPPATATVSTAPAAPAAQAPSILGKLFQPAGTAPTSATSGAATGAAPAALGSLFDRLRGDAPAAATPAPHSWLTNGPRRS